MASGRPKDKRDVSPRLRWALDEALNLLETKSGKDVAEHIAEDMEKHGIGTIVKQFAHIFPKQVDLNVSNDDAPSVIDAVDWQVLREAKKQLEAKNVETTH